MFTRTTCSGRRAERPLREASAMDYRIDYNHIDVADIMAQVKKKAAERPSVPEPPAATPHRPPRTPEIPTAEPAAPPAGPEPPIAAPAVPPPASGWKRLAKRAIRFLFRPYLRFLIPLDEWYRFRTTLEVNGRIDGTINRIAKAREEFTAGFSAVREETRQEFGTTRHAILTRIDANWNEYETTRDKLGTTRETVKLLHNLAHNLVVELTKLKVEEEALKSKARVLEKELEMLGKREKSIEKKVFE
jgi:hypothetical protein